MPNVAGTCKKVGAGFGSNMKRLCLKICPETKDLCPASPGCQLWKQVLGARVNGSEIMKNIL